MSKRGERLLGLMTLPMDAHLWSRRARIRYVRWFPISAAIIFPVQVFALVALFVFLIGGSCIMAPVLWFAEWREDRRHECRKHLRDVLRGGAS